MHRVTIMEWKQVYSAMKKILLVIALIDLLIINVLLGYFSYQYFFKTNFSNTSSETVAGGEPVCPSSCIDLIDEVKLDLIGEDIVVSPTRAAAVTTAPVSSSVKPKVKTTSYIPVPGSGSTLSNNWVDLEGTDFYLSTSDYPGLVGVYIEANIKLQNGNGEAYVRLYDVTNSRGVDNSTLSTTSGTSVFVSNGPISLWAGYNHYKVQAKSLTADTAHFESGRLKIITEN